MYLSTFCMQRIFFYRTILKKITRSYLQKKFIISIINIFWYIQQFKCIMVPISLYLSKTVLKFTGGQRYKFISDQKLHQIYTLFSPDLSVPTLNDVKASIIRYFLFELIPGSIISYRNIYKRSIPMVIIIHSVTSYQSHRKDA